MRTFLIGALFAAGVGALAAPARAQDVPASNDESPRLTTLRYVDLPGRTGPFRRALQETTQEPAQADDEGTHDSLRNGTLTGLVIGGIVGIFLVADCGHPECGPLFSFAAGIGAAVGVAIDAMFTERSLVPVEKGRTRRAPFDRAMSVGVRKTW